MAEDERPFVSPESVSQYLHCAICTCIFRRATRLLCGHTFCGQCIEEWERRGNNSCPQCRERFSRKTSTRDVLAENLVQELKVRCSYSGCLWVGALSNWESHQAMCVYHPSRVDRWLSQLSHSSSKKHSLLEKLYGRAPDAAKVLASASKDTEVLPFSLIDENITPVKKRKVDQGALKMKAKSNPINLVTPGDVVSTQQLLRVQQNSLALFFSRTYHSYKFLGLLCVLLLMCAASCAWVGVARENFPEGKEFLSLQGAASLLAFCEFLCRLGLQPFCEYAKEPLHWVDLAVLALWYFSVTLAIASSDWKYHSLVLGVQILFSFRTLVLCVRLYRHMRSSGSYESPNLNVLNISHVPGEVEVIALDESGNNSQPSQLQQSSRNIVPDQKDVRVDKNFTYFSPKHAEAGQKLEVEE